MLSTIGLAIVLFASTNVDDIFVLIGFFSDKRYRSRHVIAGQYLGIAALVAVSVVASLVSLVFAPAYVGLLGLIPIVIGLKKLFDLRSGNGDDAAEHGAPGSGIGAVLAVAGVTIANGGDNIGIYTPVFAASSMVDLTVYNLVFAVMVAVWLAFSYWLVNHPSLGAPIRRFGPVVTPFVLIAIGVHVLQAAGSLSLLGLAIAA